MSRIGSQPIVKPGAVTVARSGAEVQVKGPKGELSVPFNAALFELQVEGDEVRVAVG